MCLGRGDLARQDNDIDVAENRPDSPGAGRRSQSTALVSSHEVPTGRSTHAAMLMHRGRFGRDCSVSHRYWPAIFAGFMAKGIGRGQRMGQQRDRHRLLVFNVVADEEQDVLAGPGLSPARAV